ncbi:MAG TPA: hypothetical protein VF329_09695 [Gammaproteobacteria bacterium]
MSASGTVALGLLTTVAVFAVHRALTGADDGDAAPRPPASPSSDAEHPGSSDDAARPPPASTAQPVLEGSGEAVSLRDASASFRNTSLLIAIRDAGYVCTEIVAASDASDDHAAWRVTCSDANAYLVAADRHGRLAVEPLYYFDGPGPVSAPRGAEPPLDRQVIPIPAPTPPEP